MSLGGIASAGAKVTHQVRIFELLDNLYILQLDVEILVDALEDAADLDIIFELDRDLLVDERLEEAEMPSAVGSAGSPASRVSYGRDE